MSGLNQMIEIEYTSTAQESAQATLDFLANRPLMRMLFTSMNVLCVILCIGFSITVYLGAMRIEDVTSVVFAMLWLLFFKKINRWIIQGSLKLRNFAEVKCSFKMDDKSILYKVHTNQPQHIEWKKLKFVLRNNDGYIIPLTGMVNAGKFFWLPKRSLDSANAEGQFLDILKKFKLKVKSAT